MASKFKISEDAAEDITLALMPYSCYILRDLFRAHINTIKGDLLEMEGLSELQRAEIRGLIDDTFQSLKDDIKEQITYRFRAAFVRYVRENPPPDFDEDAYYEERDED
jgi:hypothetical protein